MYSRVRTTKKVQNYSITAKEIYTKNNEINLSLVKQMLSEGNLIELKEMLQIIKNFQKSIGNIAAYS